MKRTAAAGTLFLCLCAAASGQTNAPRAADEVTIWNGTTGAVTFGYESTTGPLSRELASNYRVVLPCTGSAHLSIATEDKTFAASLLCGHSYGLYYDEGTRRVVAKYLSPAAVAPPVMPPADEASPLQQRRDNQAAAAANRANPGRLAK